MSSFYHFRCFVVFSSEFDKKILFGPKSGKKKKSQNCPKMIFFTNESETGQIQPETALKPQNEPSCADLALKMFYSVFVRNRQKNSFGAER